MLNYLSVIIVSWNAKEYLLDCLTSLTPQIAECDGEIAVVDNASSDGSVEAVRHGFRGVEIIENVTNLGFAKANNIGIRQSTGDYLFLINSDVILRPECISTLVSYMETHPEVGLLGPRILNSDLTLQTSFRPSPTIWSALCRAFALDRIAQLARLLDSGKHHVQVGPGRQVDILSGCFWVVRRSALADAGYLDERFFMYAEDKDWCIRFWRAGWSVVYLPTAEAVHFGGASSSRDPVRFYVEEHRANLLYWKKHYGRLGEVGIFGIMLIHQLIRVGVGALMYCLRPSRRQAIGLVMRRCIACTRYLLRGALYAND